MTLAGLKVLDDGSFRNFDPPGFSALAPWHRFLPPCSPSRIYSEHDENLLMYLNPIHLENDVPPFPSSITAVRTADLPAIKQFLAETHMASSAFPDLIKFLHYLQTWIHLNPFLKGFIPVISMKPSIKRHYSLIVPVYRNPLLSLSALSLKSTTPSTVANSIIAAASYVQT